eukprot:m.50394 g.50394  ORF g.50394 m.50394 type:complete len:72 (-) comp9009_c0_seq2:1704-1919(-)
MYLCQCIYFAQSATPLLSLAALIKMGKVALQSMSWPPGSRCLSRRSDFTHTTCNVVRNSKHETTSSNASVA